MNFDTLAISSIYLDINAHNFPFEGGFKRETQTVGADYSLNPGGSGVIFSTACVALGLKPMLIGKVADDDLGRLVHAGLEEKGISSDLILTKFQKTNLSMNFINKDGKNILLSVGTANQSITSDEVVHRLEQYLDETKLLYLGSLFKFPQLIMPIIDLINSRPDRLFKILLDHGRVTNAVTSEAINLVKKLLPLVDYYIPSQDEFKHVWETDDIPTQLGKLNQEYEDLVTIVTMDEQGSIGIESNGEITKVSPKNINVVNSVGAGDSFNAGFISQVLDGKSISESMKFAQRFAEHKISHDSFENFDI